MGGTGPPPGGPTGTNQNNLAVPGNQATSYSEKVKVNVQRSERYKRNVLEINLEFDEKQINVEKDMIAKTFSRIGIDTKTQLEGYQVTPRKIFVWFKDHIE